MAKVLIVEDEESLRDVIQEEFESEGFTVATARDGQEGVEKMSSFHPDVMLLDLLMPKMSGFDVLKVIKNNPNLQKIPVLVITNINADAQDLLKNWGAADVLLKADNTPGELVERTRIILGTK